jgi:RNA polymerase-binding transcription factor DksA
MIVRMSQPDLDAIERDLSDVESSLERLDAGTYFIDEATGSTIPESVLAANPTSRHA